MNDGCARWVRSDSIGSGYDLLRCRRGVVTFLLGSLSRGKLGSRPMTTSRGTRVLATAALLLAAVTACVADGADPPLGESSRTVSPSTTSATDASTSPSPTSPTSSADKAAEAASAVVRDYFATVDRLRQQPKSPLGALKAVATGSELSAEQILIRSERDKRLHQVGDTEIVEVKVQSVNLENSDPASGKVPTVQVDVCWDVSHVDLVDKNGVSVVSPSRPDTGWFRFTVANHQWADDPDGGWRVLTGQDLEQKPCLAS